MKKFKQLAALFLAFAMVIGLFSTPTFVKAETATATTDLDLSKVKVDYENERVEITLTASQHIYFALKYKTDSHERTDWDEAYDNGTTAYVDFSNLTASKDITIFLTDDTDKAPKSVTINAQETSLAVSISGTATTTTTSAIKVANDWTTLMQKTAGYTSFGPNSDNPWTYGYLCVTVGKGENKKAMTAAQAETYLQFRKGTSGAWQSITALDLRKYSVNGAQLYFRIRPIEKTEVAVTGGAITVLGRASKEAKMTYTKQASAPKVNIHGDTKEIKLTQKQEYRVGVNGTYSAWMSVNANHVTGGRLNKIYLKDLLVASGSAWTTYDEGSSNQSVQVRIAATDKTVASKISTIKLNAATTPASVGSGCAINMELVKDTTYAKGIKVTNTTGPSIQVAVVSGPSFNVNNTAQVKWITVAPGKNVILAGTALAAGDKIIYRATTIKDKTGTTANEFVVSSAYGTYNFRNVLVPATQTFSINTATATSIAVAGVTPTVGLSGSDPYTVTVTNASPATASAITVVLDVTTVNVDLGTTPTVVCVKSASDTSDTDTATNVKLLSFGSFTSNGGKLKIQITANAATESKIFRVTIDGKVTYVTVSFSR